MTNEESKICNVNTHKSYEDNLSRGIFDFSHANNFACVSKNMEKRKCTLIPYCIKSC